jgi:hypothetical protein
LAGIHYLFLVILDHHPLKFVVLPLSDSILIDLFEKAVALFPVSCYPANLAENNPQNCFVLKAPMGLALEAICNSHYCLHYVELALEASSCCSLEATCSLAPFC